MNPPTDYSSLITPPTQEGWSEVEVERRLDAITEAQDYNKPLIQMFARLLASGVSMEECAEHLGKPIESLQALSSTERCQSLIIQYAQASKTDLVPKVLAGQAMSSLTTLMGIQNDPKTKPELRAKIAMSLLSWVYGPRVKGSAGSANSEDDFVSTDPAQVKATLDARIARMQTNLRLHPKDLFPVQPTSPLA